VHLEYVVAFRLGFNKIKNMAKSSMATQDAVIGEGYFTKWPTESNNSCKVLL
jgi:hypothetical protein